jgi:hypothetical protein
MGEGVDVDYVTYNWWECSQAGRRKYLMYLNSRVSFRHPDRSNR